MIMDLDEASEGPDEARGRPRRRRGRRALALVAVVIAGIAIWVAGPGRRTLGGWLVRQQLERAGLAGEFRVEAIDTRGITLADIHLTGPGLVRSIRGTSVRIDYQLDELRHGQVRGVSARDLDVRLDLEAAPDATEPPDLPFDARALGATLRTAQQQLVGVELDARNLTLTIERGGQPVALVEGADFAHARGSERYTLKFRRIVEPQKEPQAEPQAEPQKAPQPEPAQDAAPALGPGAAVDPPTLLGEFVAAPGPGGRELAGANQDVTIEWTPDGLTIDRFELLPGVVMRAVTFKHPAAGTLNFETQVDIDGAQLRVELAEDLRRAQVTLVRGPLDIAKLARRVDRDTVAAGTLDALDVRIADVFAPRGRWQLDGSASAPLLRYREWSLQQVAIKLAMRDGVADYDTRATLAGSPFTLTGKVNLPAQHRDDPLLWWHDAKLTGKLLAGDVQPAIVNLWNQWHPEPLGVPVPHARAQLDYSAQLAGAALDRLASHFRLSEIHIDDDKLADLAGRASWLPDDGRAEVHVELPSELAGDARPAASADIRWLARKRAYDASATATRLELAPLAGFARHFGLPLPAGTLTGTWHGYGQLDARRHAGGLTVSSAAIARAGQPEVTASARASYAWPEKVVVDELSVRQEDESLKLRGGWRDGRLTLESLEVSAPDDARLTATASVPLGARVRRWDDFWAQAGEVSGRMEARNIGLARLAKHFPQLSNELAGQLDGEVQLAGTLAAPQTSAKLSLRGLNAPGLPGGEPMDVALDLAQRDGRLAATGRVLQREATLLNLDGSVPFSHKVRSLKDWFAQPGELALAFESSLGMAQLRPFFPGQPLPESGSLQVKGNIAGTFAAPALDAWIDARGVRGGPLGTLAPSDLQATLTTLDNQLRLSGQITQPNAPPVVLSGTSGFHPRAWLDDPATLAAEPADLQLRVAGLSLRQFFTTLPGVRDFSAMVDADVTLAGPLKALAARGTLAVRQGRLQPDNDSLPTLSDMNVLLRFDGRMATLSELRVSHAGGSVSLRGSADFTDLRNPLLDLTLTGTQALLWRDDSMNARANASLRLAGPFQTAELSGTLGIVETLYYRDLEVIPTSPFRVPHKPAVVARVDALASPENPAARWNAPAAIANWSLNLNVLTEDPILLRGDRIGGSIVGKVRATGTLGNPQLDGQANLRDGRLRLPFSTLRVASGTATFTPAGGFVPQLNLRGTSRISPYDINVFVSGSAANPDVLLTSDPPLPESEVLALLATGSTTSDLNASAVTMKALQLFVENLRRTRLPFGRQLGQLVELLDEIDIRVGADDPYTGRRLSSASISLTDRVILSVAIDEEGNSRGVLMYLFRFR